VVATLQQDVAITKGAEVLACMSVKEGGLLRWYAGCCNTPIGNTMRGPKFSYVGLMHNCLEHSGKPLDEAFGPVKMRVNTTSAKQPVAATPFVTVISVLRLSGPIVMARLDGSYRRTPFFSAADLRPVAAPKVLSAEERERAYGAV